MDSFPINASGKVDRHALPVPDSSHLGSGEKGAPSDDLELILLRVWENVLGIPNLGVDDNFFDLGGHSVLAVRLLTEVEKVAGRKIPLSSLFRGSTVAYLAKLLREGSESRPEPLVSEFQPGNGGSPPLFAVATPRVRAIGYGLLARNLGEHQAFYKLQARVDLAPERPFDMTEVRSFARQYVAGMRAVQPQGPYFLAAMCGGCQIAEQMILQLEAQGQEVALFAIFDTWVLENAYRRWRWELYSLHQRLRWLRRANSRERARWIKHALENRYRIWAGTTKASRPWAEAYWPQNFRQPRFQAPVVLFKRPKQPYYYIDDPEMGWGARSAGGVEIYEIKADHHEILREPHVQYVSKILNTHLHLPSNSKERSAASGLAPSHAIATSFQ